MTGKAIQKMRERLGMSQPQFAKAFQLSLGAVHHWEQSTRRPRGPALALLKVIAFDAETVINALSQGKGRRHG